MPIPKSVLTRYFKRTKRRAAMSENYELLIISPSEFVEALQPLIDHKNYTDMPTCLLTLEEIDSAHEGRDRPERIKRAIAHYETTKNVKYAMLVGDINKFPVRHIMAINTEWDTRFYPSDLYYADLYDDDGNLDNWDYDNDGYFGETNFAGGQNTPQVNMDRINLKPDIAVGRIPASTVQEVTNYVNKIIKYEFSAWRSNWIKKALLVSDHNTAGCFSDRNHADSIETLLSDFLKTKLYLKTEPYRSMNVSQRSAKINETIEDGVGFIGHMGHGNPNSWDKFYLRANIADLENTKTFPIVSTIACLTAVFQYSPEFYQYERYWTNEDTEWRGTGVREAERPMPASLQPAEYDFDSMAEEFLVKHEAGAISYMGSVCKGEHGGKALQRYFVEQLSYSSSWTTLGTMWQNAMIKFAENEAEPGMGHYYAYIHQHKVILFGDPSLRIMGVPRYQRQDFTGTYSMIHDSWKGTLTLAATDGDYIESTPNIKGTYTGNNGSVHNVYGYVRTWNYPLPKDWGPDHQIAINIDFRNTPTTSDDQKFIGYLCNHRRSIAGTVWWNKIPFGFYAVKDE